MPPLRALMPVALATLLLAAPAVRAEPVSFSYSLMLGEPGSSGTSVTLYDYGGATGTLTVAAGSTASATPGGAGDGNAVGATITVATVSVDLLPGSIPYAEFVPGVKLLLTDTASGQSGTTSLSAYLWGYNDPSSDTSAMWGATSGFGAALHLGGHTYTFESFMGSEDSLTGRGSMIVWVYVDRPVYDPPRVGTLPPPVLLAHGPITRAPEPSSLALTAVAVSILGGWAVRRRQGLPVPSMPR